MVSVGGGEGRFAIDRGWSLVSELFVGNEGWLQRGFAGCKDRLSPRQRSCPSTGFALAEERDAANS
jgi:hypothetical protein